MLNNYVGTKDGLPKSIVDDIVFFTGTCSPMLSHVKCYLVFIIPVTPLTLVFNSLYQNTEWI